MAYCHRPIATRRSRAASSSGFRFYANTNHENIRGFQSDDSKTLNLEFAFNRSIQPDGLSYNRFVLAGTTNWDGGALAGGNYWSFFTPSGNPSQSTPYGTNGQSSSSLGVYDSLTNTTGRIVDRYPFQNESFGRGGAITIHEPRAGFSFAQGTRHTVRWSAPACVYVDITLDNSTLLIGDAPNTGYAVVTIPAGASVGAHTIQMLCSNSNGVAFGSGTSASFNVAPSTAYKLTFAVQPSNVTAGVAINRKG